MATGAVPVIGEDVVVSEGRPLPVQCLPMEVGLRRQAVEYTCFDASQQLLVVGSAQGYVWVVDLQSSHLLKEFSGGVKGLASYLTMHGESWASSANITDIQKEFKGSAITAVKLNPVRDYIAYGTDHGFIRVERISKVKFNKLRVQEKSGQGVHCIEWSQNGEDIYCGFSLGRIVHFNVKFKSDAMNHIPLYPEQYGSSVVQLSLSENLLLVSTLERTFLLDVITNKLDQVGRKERKPGVYGGCFVDNGESLLVARPGLRMWIADKFGKVLNTMAFKEVLSSRNLPPVVFNSVPTSSVQFSRSWQFSTLHPILGGKFIVTFQEKILLILDPRNGAVLGVAALQHDIKSVVPSGGFLYVLSKVPVRVAVHHSYVTMEYEPKRLLRSTLSTPCTSVGNSPLGSLENLAKEAQSGKEFDDHCVSEPLLKDKQAGNDTELVSTACPVKDSIESYAVMPAAGSPNTLPLPGNDEWEDKCDPHLESSVCEHIVITHPESIAAHVEEEVPDSEEVCKRGEQSEEASADGEDMTNLSVHSGQGLKLELLKPALGKLSNMLSPPSPTKPASREEHSDEDGDVDGAKEEARRLRMAQAAGDDIIANNKSHRKRRRRTKGKKISSAASSTSVSMEKLADIVEERVDDRRTPDEQEVDEEMTPGAQQLVSTDQLVRSPEPPGDLVDTSFDLTSASPHTKVQALEFDLEQQECMVLEDFIEDVSGVPSVIVTADHASKQLIDNESGQQFPSSEVFESKLETRANPSLVSETWSAAAEGKHSDEGDEVHNITTERESDVAVVATEDDANDSAPEDAGVMLEGDGDVPINIIKGRTDAFGEDVCDNPLYQDADEDNHTLGIEEVITSPQDSGPAHPISQHCVLQPALSDPLQNEETLETGTNSDRSRHITLPESFAVTTRFPSRRHDNISTQKVNRGVTSWIDISEKDTCYSREHNFDASDSSHDSEAESVTEASVTDSQVADDFYQLCGALVKTTDEPQQYPVSENLFSQASISDSNSLNQASRLCEAQEGESNEKVSEEQSMDIWMSVSLPSRHSLQCISLSDMLLWAVDSRNQVFYTTTSNRGRIWQRIKKAMQQVASSPSGHVVWSIYHQNAYVRLGIGMNAAGSMWKNVTKNTSLAHKIKQLSVEENGVWAVAVDNRVLFRKGVDERNPEGKVWQEVSYGMNFSYIACCKSAAWALNHHGKVFVRDGITPSTPSGKKWLEIKSPSMVTVSIITNGVVWGINEEGSVGFRTGINPGKPGGRGPWWEVMITSDSQAISPLHSLWHAMGADGMLSSAVSSLVSLPHQHQVTMVSASSKSGVVVLESGHRLYGCWRMATGYHYTPACKEGVFQFNMWSHVAAGGTSLWFVRNDGDLYCLSPGSELKRIEVPSNVELITASPNCMWVISKDMVWSRQGMTVDLPEGISFDYIELSTLLHDKKLRSVACGKKVAWGIDSSGVPHFRFGVHAREPGTGMSPAWVPIEDHPGPLLQIAVCPDDWMVWACDEEYNVYVRGGVTIDFPVGKNWVRIPKQKIKELAATSDRMYGLSPSGELMCRYGVSKNNVLGNFWRKMPGKYEHITTGMFGELWTLDGKGQVWKQEWKVITVSDMHTDFDPSTTGDSEAWEFV